MTRALLVIYSALVMLFLILPNLIVIPVAFTDSRLIQFPPQAYTLDWFGKFFGSRSWLSSLGTSFQVAVLSTICALFVGTAAAYSLARYNFGGRRLVTALSLSPVIISALVFAIASYRLFSDIGLIGSVLGFVVAHTILTVPFVIIVMRVAFDNIDVRLEQAARTMGATELEVLRFVTLPLAKRGLISAGLFAFLISFDELMVALFISTPRTFTLPKRLWDGIREDFEPTLAAVSTLLVLVSIIVVIVAGLLSQQRGRDQT